MNDPKMDRPAPAAGERKIVRSTSGWYHVLEYREHKSVTGDHWQEVADYLSREDALLLVHGGRVVAALERADEIVQSTCSSDVVGKAWAEAADEWQVEVRTILAAVRGTP